MGAYASHFDPQDETPIAEQTSPEKEDWITAHAEATGLAVVEVERLWIRFEQLGADAELGVLSEQAQNNPRLAKDAFVKNILISLRDERGNISFEVFLNAMNWCESQDLELKLRSLFHLLNAGNAISRDTFTRILRHVYTGDSEEAIERIADTFMLQMDRTNTGKVTENGFIAYMKTLPPQKVSNSLRFHIIPQDINEEAHRSFTTDTMATMERAQSEEDYGKQIPSDQVLRKIAEKAKKRDWHVLANQLDFTSDDIAEFEQKYPRDVQEQIYFLLKTWKSQEGDGAYAEILEKALRDSNMTDISLMLAP